MFIQSYDEKLTAYWRVIDTKVFLVIRSRKYVRTTTLTIATAAAAAGAAPSTATAAIPAALSKPPAPTAKPVAAAASAPKPAASAASAASSGAAASVAAPTPTAPLEAAQTKADQALSADQTHAIVKGQRFRSGPESSQISSVHRLVSEG